LVPTWSTEGEPGLSFDIPASRLPVLALVVVAGLGALVLLGARVHALEGQVRQLRAAVTAGTRREHALEATVARQHQTILTSQGDLEMMRFQMEAVELQLDGVDYLAGQVRTELGLPAGSGTWSGDAPSTVPQGGAATGGVDRDRLSRAQRRAAVGLAELYQLGEVARARRQPQTPAEPARVASTAPPANWPARGEVTSDFGWRVFRGVPSFHTGVDVAVAYGSQVQATADGVVLGSGWQPGYGWSVLVQHAQGYCTFFAHLSEALVQVGDRVRIGDVLGLSGSSGNSTGPHLHYEVWKDGSVLDPRPFMDGSGAR
jgi:murein DD-endopeptidase MepM/ murein hydrolase activator NlpD